MERAGRGKHDLDFSSLLESFILFFKMVFIIFKIGVSLRYTIALAGPQDNDEVSVYITTR